MNTMLGGFSLISLMSHSPGGGVARMIVSWMKPRTVAMTSKEIKMPFQSLDLLGIETSSCK